MVGRSWNGSKSDGSQLEKVRKSNIFDVGVGQFTHCIVIDLFLAEVVEFGGARCEEVVNMSCSPKARLARKNPRGQRGNDRCRINAVSAVVVGKMTVELDLILTVAGDGAGSAAKLCREDLGVCC